MKVLIFIITISTLIFSVACSTTSHVRLTENNREQIKQKLTDYGQDEDLGAEITLSKTNGSEINGELLSVRDSSITICAEYSVAEEELANLTYLITIVRTDEMQELTIEGSSYVWVGVGAGLLVGAGIGYIVANTASNDVTYGALIGGGLIIIAASVAGGLIGKSLSDEEFVLQEIPPGFDFSLLKSFARYPEEEPEYLRSIK